MSEPADAPPAAETSAAPRSSPGELRRSIVAVRAQTPELELLISGAVLFALFRLCELADATFFRLMINLGGALLQGVIIAHEYVKLILYTLIVAFVGHLALRAWWIGLVTVDAAFPAGPRWDRLRSYGPATLEVYRDSVPRVRRMMAAAATMSSIVFATGLAFAVVFALSVVAVLLFGVAGWLLSLLFPALSVGRAFLVVSVTVAGLMLGVGLVDKVRGERILASPGGSRWLRRAVRTTTWLAGARLFAPITLLLLSHLPKRRVYVGFGLGMGLVVALFLVRDVLLGFGIVGFDSHRYLTARPGAGGFEPQYYETYREPWGVPWRLPSLSSDLATGPYLRLFVPFSPERAEEAVRAHCPDLPPRFEPGLRVERRYGDPGAEPAAAAALRDCLLRHVRIELDGKPLPAERFLLGVHPVSGGRGLLTQLPTEDLASGEHRVVVVEMREPGDERPPRRHVIPFWR